jgi:hypothetical protein
MKYLVCFLFVLMTGCSTVVPVTSKFPDVPERLMVKCPRLEKVSETPTLSDVAKTITNNYTTYYDCAVKHDAFIEWYNIQKNIFESVK